MNCAGIVIELKICNGDLCNYLKINNALKRDRNELHELIGYLIKNISAMIKRNKYI